MTLHLPTVNAFLNGASAVLLGLGFLAVRRGRHRLHQRLMLGAVACSALFLISYVTYHLTRTGLTRYRGSGASRAVYYAVLGSHSLLAAGNVPLVVLTLARALRRDFARHRAVARWTLGIWLYVSVTGVAVYLMLYRF